MGKDRMEKGKNIIILVNYYLMVIIIMEKEKNIAIMEI